MRFGHEICWSRVYEYPFALAQIAALATASAAFTTRPGAHDIHLVFKTLARRGVRPHLPQHLRPSTLFIPPSGLTNPPSEALRDRFDVVLNISTLEEVAADHVQVLKHHLVHAAAGGRFIGTFDFPGLQLENVEDFGE